MEVVIHIGPPKTGSTAIQRYLMENRESLRNKKIYFPSELNFISLLRYIRNEELKNSQVIQELKSAATDDYDMLILSCEFYSSFTIGEWGRLKRFFTDLASGKENFDFNIILYVRDPLKILLSSRQEMLKKGYTLKELSNNRLSLLYRNIYSRLLSVFSKEQITSRVFNDTEKSFDVVNDFCNLFHIEYKRKEVVKHNASLCLEAAFILDKINQKNEVRKAVDKETLSGLLSLSGRPFVISKDELDIMINDIEAERKWIFETLKIDLSIDMPNGYKKEDVLAF